MGRIPQNIKTRINLNKHLEKSKCFFRVRKGLKMDKAKIGITNVEFSGSNEIESATVKLELNIYGTDTFSAIELLPKILTDIHSLSYEVDLF